MLALGEPNGVVERAEDVECAAGEEPAEAHLLRAALEAVCEQGVGDGEDGREAEGDEDHCARPAVGTGRELVAEDGVDGDCAG